MKEKKKKKKRAGRAGGRVVRQEDSGLNMGARSPVQAWPSAPLWTSAQPVWYNPGLVSLINSLKLVRCFQSF